MSSSHARFQAIRPGKSAPDFLLPQDNDAPVTFYERYCGQGPVVMVFCSALEGLDRFAPMAGRSHFIGVFSGVSTRKDDRPFTVLNDDGRLTQAFLGVAQTDSPVVLILRSTLTVLTCLDNPAIEQIEPILDALPVQTSEVCAYAAPVLMVPDVLPLELCTELIAAHDADHFDSGMLRMVDGKPALAQDARVKIRRDHLLKDTELAQTVTDALIDRLLPVVARAFHYTVAHMEGYKIVCYDSATGGYFRPHRDNVTPDAKHRRFALSLNLNADYEGGEILFPEFGATRYRPPVGGAVVFSGTLLHAATDVTVGKRYVLLTFMWGDDVTG